MIFKIFKKELKETIRDRKTMLIMVAIPLLVFPILINVVVSVSGSFNESASEKILKIGIIGDSNDLIVKQLKSIPASFGPKELIAYKGDSAKLFKDQNNEVIDIALWYDSGIERILSTQGTANILWAIDNTNIGYSERIKGYMNIIEKEERLKRYDELGIDEQKLQPYRITYQNTASDRQMLGELAGGILPYIFIAFGFLGCMYPAIDLFSGEKERGTIETLLSTPVERWKILIGKMLVVVLSGLTASFSALFGLFVSIEFLGLIPDPTLMAVVSKILTFSIIIKLFALLLPLTVFFAGIMIPISVYTKSFKEAQSIITPLNVVVVLPAMLGLFPGIELNYLTACIPILNIVLTTKSLIAGNLDYILLAISFLIMLSIAVAAVFFLFASLEKKLIF